MTQTWRSLSENAIVIQRARPKSAFLHPASRATRNTASSFHVHDSRGWAEGPSAWGSMRACIGTRSAGGNHGFERGAGIHQTSEASLWVKGWLGCITNMRIIGIFLQMMQMAYTSPLNWNLQKNSLRLIHRCIIIQRAPMPHQHKQHNRYAHNDQNKIKPRIAD